MNGCQIPLWRRVLRGRSATLVLLMGVLLLGAAKSLGAEPYPDLLGASLEPHHISRNYAGDFIMRFPNYDFILFSPFRSSPAITTEPVEVNVGNVSQTSSRQFRPTQTGPIVFRNSAGMYWDGSQLFLSPGYPYRMVERFRYALNIVGEPEGTKWPSLEREMPTAPPRREPMVFEPTVAYRSLPPQAPVTLAPPSELPKYFPSSLPPLTNGLTPQYRHPVPAGPIPTHPVSTIRVRPWQADEIEPPVHDSLGIFTPVTPAVRR